MIQQMSLDYTGVDISFELVKNAKESYPGVNFIVGSVLNLPFEDECFDKVISIAVLHHIPSLALRIKFMEEGYRVLKKDGQMIITV
jgi:tRNA (uracil-5-)-methyltransferase TRM9